MWRICVDTGGTFTDCIARDPAGVAHRVKVLSTAALRGRVLDAAGCRLTVDASWLTSDGLVDGFEVRTLDEAVIGRVVSTDAVAGVITLDATPPERVQRGDPFEVRTDEPAPILAARLVTRTPVGHALPPTRLRLATTRGTNALLERRGADVAFFVTEGFADLLRIGDQQRPDIFALRIEPRPVLTRAIVEVPERLGPDGVVERDLDLEAVRRHAERLIGEGIRVAAVALLHSYVDPTHEEAVAAILHEAGFDHVSCSARLAPLIKIVTRAQTAVVDAYLTPIVRGHLDEVATRLGPDADAGNRRVHVMTSAGGLSSPATFAAKDSLLSGPAGGVAGAVAAGVRSGFDRLVVFDMGGTSTDVARWAGDFEYRFEHRVGGVTLAAPALAIESVAAGGGSICRYENGRLEVGPESAGARPGPACYGAGGPLTLTDVNLLLGRVDPGRFEIPIVVGPARTTLEALCDRIAADAGGDDPDPAPDPDPDHVLEGLLAIANERMAGAIDQVSLERGHDPAECTLVAFGGAGGQHACAIAERLGITTVLVPADAPVLSAAGLADAAIERFAERQVLRGLDDVAGELPGLLDELATQARRHVVREGVPDEDVVVRRRLASLRLLGQDSTLTIEASTPETLAVAFRDRYTTLYGHPPPDRVIEVESLRVVASSRPASSAGGGATPGPSGDRPRESASPATVRTRFEGRWIETPVHARDTLAVGVELEGPALVHDRQTTHVVAPGWRTHVDAAGALVTGRDAGHPGLGTDARPIVVEAVRQELFMHRFTAIAEEMGRMLQRTALSTNVKERLDFSCAILDAAGELVVNAPHLPVHLGALGTCVRSVRDEIEMEPGDVVVTNHPAFGGSHLPDVTVITPVFADDGTRLGDVANRAHHAEIGGTRPGSMAPHARTLAEEGVVIAPTHLVRRGESRFDQIGTLLRAGPHPSRAVDENLADLHAQVAANERGRRALETLATQAGVDEVARRMGDLTDRTERIMRSVLAGRPDGTTRAEERLDDGAVLRVAITVRGDEAVVDFAGTAACHAGNLNATPAIARSVVIYVLRLLLGAAARGGPLNEGLMRPIDLRIPPGLLDPPFTDDPSTSPAVVAGNVETSQRLVDLLLKTLDLAACSQGTMNNVLFGADRFGYYETVAGGAGAGPGFDGADGVHTHMTNTRITDPEVLEHRYPVRLEAFAVRRGSGGRGRWRGGDGLVRRYRFEAPLALSVLTQHRATRPYGLAGGGSGRPGEQHVIRAGGERVALAPLDTCDVQPGDRLVLETPGAGAYGEDSSAMA